MKRLVNSAVHKCGKGLLISLEFCVQIFVLNWVELTQLSCLSISQMMSGIIGTGSGTPYLLHQQRRRESLRNSQDEQDGRYSCKDHHDPKNPSPSQRASCNAETNLLVLMTTQEPHDLGILTIHPQLVRRPGQRTRPQSRWTWRSPCAWDPTCRPARRHNCSMAHKQRSRPGNV